MGNDWCPPLQKPLPPSYLFSAIDKFFDKIPRDIPYRNLGLVYGGSSRTWGYVSKLGAEAAHAYDAAVEQVLKYCAQQRYLCLTSSEGLRGIVTVDRIGHVSVDSLDLLVQYYTGLALTFLQQQRSKL